MHALHAARTAPLRAAVRLHSVRAGTGDTATGDAGTDDTGTDDTGMATAEYAVATVAACGFGGILYKVITSDTVLDLVTDVIGRAFKLVF